MIFSGRSWVIILLSIVLAACAGGGQKLPALTKSDSVLYSLAPSSLLVISADTDRDLITSDVEFSAYIAALFIDIDSDSSGSVGPIEYDRWALNFLGSSELQPAFYTFDKNVDNKVTLDEFEKAGTILFGRLDKDEDSRVTRAELIIERQFRGTPNARRSQGRPIQER